MPSKRRKLSMAPKQKRQREEQELQQYLKEKEERKKQKKFSVLPAEMYEAWPSIFLLFAGVLLLPSGKANPIAAALVGYLDLPQFIELYRHVGFIISQFDRFRLWTLYYMNSRVFPITILKHPAFLYTGAAIRKFVFEFRQTPCVSCLVAAPVVFFANRCLDCVRGFKNSYLVPADIFYYSLPTINKLQSEGNYSVVPWIDDFDGFVKYLNINFRCISTRFVANVIHFIGEDAFIEPRTAACFTQHMNETFGDPKKYSLVRSEKQTTMYESISDRLREPFVLPRATDICYEEGSLVPLSTSPAPSQ